VLDLISNIRYFLINLNPLVVLVVIFIFGMYIFWRGSAESRKNRSSVFDMFLISGFISAIVGRLIYILVEWQSFSTYIWYWLPYEKYGEKIFLFRLLPWRFFSIWDGGLIILSMFVTLLLSLTFYSIFIKKWRWKHMFFPIYFSAISMLGASFVVTGLLDNFNEWVYKGAVLVFLIAIFFVIYKFIYMVVSSPVVEKYILGYVGLIIVWISSLYIAYIYLMDDLSWYENFSVGVFLLWSLVAGILFLIDLRKANVRIETRSSVRSVHVN